MWLSLLRWVSSKFLPRQSASHCLKFTDTPTTEHDRLRVDGIRPHNTDMGRQEFSMTPIHIPALPPVYLSSLRVIWVIFKFPMPHKSLSGSCTRSCSCSTIQQNNEREEKKKGPRKGPGVSHTVVLLEPFRGYFTGSAVMRSG